MVTLDLYGIGFVAALWLIPCAVAWATGEPISYERVGRDLWQVLFWAILWPIFVVGLAGYLWSNRPTPGGGQRAE